MKPTAIVRAALLTGFAACFSVSAHSENFRAECYDHYSIVHRGTPTNSASDYDWKTEDEFEQAENSATLILLDLPARSFDWIDSGEAKGRISRFSNGVENKFSVSNGSGEFFVKGPQLSFSMLGTWPGEWTIELLGEGRAILRFLSATNTSDGVMIEISHAECTLSGSHSILDRNPASSPPENYEERFWKEAEDAILNRAPTSEETLRSGKVTEQP
tara:strand:- start:344 stop:991 length:648 start_codon:yes stop_codon:yes gene_type:complete